MKSVMQKIGTRELLLLNNNEVLKSLELVCGRNLEKSGDVG
jgi:hypothetical protein